MSVQQNVQLYQTSKGVGVIGENQPYDTKSFITSAASTELTWGVFAQRIGTTNGQAANEVIELSSDTDLALGATVKQLDRVDGEVLGIVKDSEGNSTSLFTLSAGKPANIMRMGYLSMPAVGEWIEGRLLAANKVYVRIAKTVSTDLIGEVANDFSALTVATDWAQFPVGSPVIFADSSDTGTSKVATVYFDLRVPISLEPADNA
jgi:hypothetical protein